MASPPTAAPATVATSTVTALITIKGYNEYGWKDIFTPPASEVEALREKSRKNALINTVRRNQTSSAKYKPVLRYTNVFEQIMDRSHESVKHALGMCMAGNYWSCMDKINFSEENEKSHGKLAEDLAPLILAFSLLGTNTPSFNHMDSREAKVLKTCLARGYPAFVASEARRLNLGEPLPATKCTLYLAHRASQSEEALATATTTELYEYARIRSGFPPSSSSSPSPPSSSPSSSPSSPSSTPPGEGAAPVPPPNPVWNEIDKELSARLLYGLRNFLRMRRSDREAWPEVNRRRVHNTWTLWKNVYDLSLGYETDVPDSNYVYISGYLESKDLEAKLYERAREVARREEQDRLDFDNL